jgi:hypothetical protein
MAFLHGHFHEEIYMMQLEGFVYLSCEHQLCWLLWSSYGLKQALCAWYECIDSYFHHVGFLCTTIDYNVYVHWHGASFIIIVLYVDDAILVCNTPFLLQHIKIKLQWAFVMTDCGTIHHLLGMQILCTYQASTLFFTQANYFQTKLEFLE